MADPYKKLSRICVFSGSRSGNHPEFRKAARTLGDVLAEFRLELIYGGAKVGLMGELADRVLHRGGKVTGVIPKFLKAKEVAHEGLTRLLEVRTMHERKQVMERESDGFIALPGGVGTLEEIFEMITWSQLCLHRKPCGFLNVEGYFDTIQEFLGNAVKEGFIQKEIVADILFDSNARSLLQKFDHYSPHPSDKASYALNAGDIHRRED